MQRMTLGFLTLLNTCLLAVAVSFGVGCEKIPGLKASPSKVVEKSYSACNDGTYSEAEAYLTTDLRNLLKGPTGQMRGGIKGMCDKATRNGTLLKIDILSEEVRGEGASVTAKLYFKDGSTKDDDVTMLIKEDGEWRVTTGGH